MIIENIIILASAEKITLTELEKAIGASKGVLTRSAKNKTDIQSKWVSKIVENYPRYSGYWILTGKGPMLKEEKEESEVYFNLPEDRGFDLDALDEIPRQYIEQLEINYKVLKLEYESQADLMKKKDTLLGMYKKLKKGPF